MGSAKSVPAGGPVGGFFEGTEKRIEIDFRGAADGAEGLLQLPDDVWHEVIRLCNTQALSCKKAGGFTSFLLSESSLIVYPHKVIVKTCGRTQPLASIAKIYEVARGIMLEPEWFSYSRKNFMAPQQQPPEHQSLYREAELCRAACNGIGQAYVLGPVTGDHWLMFDAEMLETDCTTRGDLHVDMMMYDLPEEVRKKFYTEEPEGSEAGAKAMTNASGIGDIVRSLGGEIDDYCFAPCGYSCNIHASDCYGISHVTPEEQCSYASWETNLGYSKTRLQDQIAPKISDVVSRVLDAFQPGRVTLTLFIDEGANAAIGSAPFDTVPVRYKRLNWSSTHFPNEYMATVANYVLSGSSR